MGYLEEISRGRAAVDELVGLIDHEALDKPLVLSHIARGFFKLPRGTIVPVFQQMVIG